MAYTASFFALPFTAFSNTPAGQPDPDFVLAADGLDTIYSVTINDADDGGVPDNTIDGDTITNEIADDATQLATVTDASGTPIAPTQPIYIEWTATYTGTNSQVIEMWRFELADGTRFFAVSEAPEPGITYTTTNKDLAADDLDPDDIPRFPCFVEGTRVMTPAGERAIERLKVGDWVITQDRGQQQIRWIGKRSFTPEEIDDDFRLQPVLIKQNSLGHDLPRRDLWVSRQHRMVVRSSVAARMFEIGEVFVPAIQLTRLNGIRNMRPKEPLTYYHLLFDNHEVIFAEGSPTESLYIGEIAEEHLGRDVMEEIALIFPEVLKKGFMPALARIQPKQKQQRRLVARHARNGQILVG
ncbi:MAG: Hint domain-containing protein [Pseudomonadota bacterium]